MRKIRMVVSVYLAQSGQWAWYIEENGVRMVAGAGYDVEGDAWAAMEAECFQRMDRLACLIESAQ